MAVPEITIEMFQGEDRVPEFRVTPVEDITGWTIEMFIGLSTVVTKPGFPIDAPSGKYGTPIARADTLSEEAGDYEFEVWRTDALLNRVLAVGTLLLKEAVRT